LTESSAFLLKGICVYAENGTEEITAFARKRQIPVAFVLASLFMMKEKLYQYSYGNGKRKRLTS
jgi:hypothetical protein